MIPTHRTFWTISIVVMFALGISGCGEKRLAVSNSSGKANGQEEQAASVQDTHSEPTGIQDSSLTETGLGSELASQGPTNQETAQETAMVVEPPPLPTIRGENEDDSFGTSGTGEETQHFSNSGAEEEIPAPSTDQTARDPGFQPSASGTEDGASLGSRETDQATTPMGSSSEEEFGALFQPTDHKGEMMESPHVERIPENIAVAKVESSNAVEEQLARIQEDELATAAAGLQDIFFEFDSWKITDQGKDMLEKNANLLQEESNKNLLIEGHCDQRGTQAYNIVLGKKRATAIRDYLVHLGVEPTRLTVITYGKERPFCTDTTEFCYQENRRGHLIVQ